MMAYCKTLLAAPLAALLVCAPGIVRAEQVLVFAAASLRDALQEVADDWQQATGHVVVLSLAGSSTLARQIAAGAPADIFLSASPDWVDVLEREGLVRAGSRRDLLSNDLVVIAHDPSAPPLDFATPDGLAARLGDERLAMALIEAVPAGIYGKAALESLGWWETLAPQVAQADNVRAALALVATGEAPYGIVYATDARAEPRVTSVGRFPDATHPPIVYPLVVTADSASAVAGPFADYLGGDAAAAVFQAHGFGLADAAEAAR